MDYEQLLPDWDRDPRKCAPLDSRLQEMLIQHTDADPRWQDTVFALSDDLVSADQVPAALAAVSRHITGLMIYMHGGRDEAVAAMRECLEQLRRITARGMDE